MEAGSAVAVSRRSPHNQDIERFDLRNSRQPESFAHNSGI
jgi:hypothetical protein